MLSFSNSIASLPMSTESQLREKFRKIEALFAGAGTAGERLAAGAPREHAREGLTELGRQDPSIEMQFSMPDQWSRHLFLALCRRYGMKPYRYYRQRRNTVMIRAPKRCLDQVLWPEFSELDQALQAYLHQVTMRVIREEVFADASEAPEISEALPPNNGRVFEAAHTVQRGGGDRSKNSTPVRFGPRAPTHTGRAVRIRRRRN